MKNEIPISLLKICASSLSESEEDDADWDLPLLQLEERLHPER